MGRLFFSKKAIHWGVVGWNECEGIYPHTFVGGAVGAAEDGCEVEDVVVAGGLEAQEGGRGVFVVLVELFD